MAERRYVVATAGHVDHGKSTLVRALTGMEPDRFAEERRRGMTIDLGYAWTTLPSGAQLAFVDVPGHERFIANMLSGLGPAPAVMVVVAADEGWSRQSEEHLAAVDALQIAHGLLVVTRSDLADPAGALADCRSRLARSSLGEVASVVVSGATGAGIDELRGALDRLLAAMPAPDDDAAVRLWLDRSFSVRGAGTVVTGTLVGGAVAVGDTLELRGRPVTVRGLQSTGVTQQRLTGTSRVAVNVRGVDSDDVGRGEVLLTPNRWHLTDRVDVRASTPAAELAAELTLHVGTAAVPVRVRPLGSGHARLALRRALPLRAGDRAVLRDPGQHAVVAGVLVLDADPPELARRGAAADRGRELAGLAVPPDVTVELARRGAVRREHLERLGIDTTTVADDNGWLVAPGLREQWASGARAAVSAWAAQRPLDPAMPRAALRRALGLPDDVLLDLVVKEAELSEVDGRVSVPGGTPTSFGAADAAIRALVTRLTAQPFAAPDADELGRLKLGNRELAAAARSRVLLRLGDVVLLPGAPRRAAALLRELPQPFTTSQAREALGATRRIAIPLLEHLDELGLTERVSPTHRRVL